MTALSAPDAGDPARADDRPGAPPPSTAAGTGAGSPATPRVRPAEAARTRAGDRFRRLPIRHKLLVLVLLPLGVASPLLGLTLLAWSSEGVDRLLEAKVRSDLAVAHGYFDRVLGEVGAGTAAIADSQVLHRALVDRIVDDRAGTPALGELLQQLRARERLDFLVLRTPDGRVVNGDRGPGVAAVIGQAGWMASPGARGGQRASVERLDGDDLRLLPPDLRDRVTVPLVPTRNAVPSPRTREDRALVLLSTQAVRRPDGELLGHVQAGVLLNRNLPFIDHVNEIVYPRGSLPFDATGTTTLFLDDVRIATNVRLFTGTPPEAPEGVPVPRDGERAIGTRVSREVRDAVLVQGRTWLGRAFVVNDWYVSGYQPLVDGDGRRVGMLYVGVLERPFVRLKYAALAAIGAVFFSVMVGAAWLSMRWARAISRPIEAMESTIDRIEAGTPEARVGDVGSVDEIGRLAQHLDHLLDTLDARDRELRRWNAELDAKVAERTSALAETRDRLVRSEKLATIGQLAASVAHEMNNPIGVIQGNLDLLRELLGPAATPVRGELRLVDEQIERMRLIVTQLLQFSRPGEYAGYIEPVAPATALDDGLLLTGHQLARGGVRVIRDESTTRTAAVNRQELKQVLVNLMVNALHAMPEGGDLRLVTRDWDDDAGRPLGVRIAVEDSGAGLTPAVRANLFQPFVTGKKDGTGLGLWISRGIVERYGGDITAGDREDGRPGAVFTVWLRSGATPA